MLIIIFHAFVQILNDHNFKSSWFNAISIIAAYIFILSYLIIFGLVFFKHSRPQQYVLPFCDINFND
jgi:hypothetical protein